MLSTFIVSVCDVVTTYSLLSKGHIRCWVWAVSRRHRTSLLGQWWLWGAL